MYKRQEEEEEEEEMESDWESSEEEIPQNYSDLLHKLSIKWLSVHLTHNVSLEATYEFWKIALLCMPLLVQYKEEEEITRKTPQFVHLRRKLYDELCPKVYMDFEYTNKSTNETIHITSAKKTPVKTYQRNPDYIKKFEAAHILSLIHI